MCVCLGCPQRVLDPLGLKVQAVVSCPIPALETDPGSSANVECALN